MSQISPRCADVDVMWLRQQLNTLSSANVFRIGICPVAKGNEVELCCWLFLPFNHFSISNSVVSTVIMFTFTLLLSDLGKIGAIVIDGCRENVPILEEV